MIEFHVYFHRDFDGLCAASLFSSIFFQIATILKLAENENLVYHPVDYDIKENWLESKLFKPNAVLDFLYHPEADWWFDHHFSSFLESNLKKKYKHTPSHFWSTKFCSCPSLIKYHFKTFWPLFANLKEFQKLIESYSKWIEWSDIIDSAGYHSPNEPIELNHPCLKINATLSVDISSEYLVYLIEHIKTSTPDEVANLEPVNLKFLVYKNKQEEIIEKFKSLLEIYNREIAYFDLANRDIPFQRYLSYYFHPKLSYTIGLYKKNKLSFVVSVGKNPWKQFQSENVGKICKRYGGGGRKDVGAIMVGDYKSAVNISKKIRKYLLQSLQIVKEK